LGEPNLGASRPPSRSEWKGQLPHLCAVGRKTRVERVRNALYSAAAGSEAFGFAADIMKSEMRGTISDLNLEPLNTP
jgi:hypothetical protein